MNNNSTEFISDWGIIFFFVSRKALLKEELKDNNNKSAKSWMKIEVFLVYCCKAVKPLLLLVVFIVGFPVKL